MTLLNIQNLAFYFGERKLFSNVNFDINEKEKVGFIGSNGVGKTTIFKIIRGELIPTEGSVIMSRSVRVGYMEQHTCSEKGRTLYDELISVFNDLIELENKIKNVNYCLENNIGDINENIKLQDELNNRFNSDGGLTFRSRTRSALLGLGFEENDFNLSTDKLSGGQRSKVALAKLLLSESDLLLLDEPTNHLDIKSVEWLEGFLKTYNGAIFVISHDRYFLDKITDKTVELENCKIRSFKGNYSEFIVKKKAEQKAIEDKYDCDMKEILRLEAVVAQQRQWNKEKNIKTAESKLKQIDRIKQQLVVPDSKVEKIHFNFTPKAVCGNDVITVDGLSKYFSRKKIFENVSFQIKKGERVFLLGDNGCGKTTLFKVLMGDYVPTDGKFIFGENLFKGYFDQVQEKLDLSKTAIEEVWTTYPRMTQTQVRTALAAFLFKGDSVFKLMSELSGGERARIALLKLMLGGYNFLLLDEPTNHLDAISREELENTLIEYEGTMFIISHDRYFINKLCTRILELNDNGITEFQGNYDYYVERKSKILTEPKHNIDSVKSDKSNDYKLKKEQAAEKRKLESQLKRTESEIETIENEINEIQSILNSDAVQTDYEKLIEYTDKLNNKNCDLDDKYKLWEDIQEKLN